MEKIDNNSSDVSPLNRDEVINDSDFKDLMSRLENPENLCGTRYITTRYNSVKGIYEALVLGIAKTEEVSDFSKSKKGKVESAGGKYYEYYKNPDKRVGTKNKTSVLKNLNGKNSVSQFLEEHKEETGIRKDFVKRVKYLKSFSRPIEGEYSLDKRVNTKVTDVFVVEVPSYADVALNNPNSDDDHNGSLWIPLREMKEVIDSPSSKEVFDQLPKYYFPEVFDLIRGDISEKIHNKVLQLFEHLNKDSEIYKDLKRGLKKNNRSDKLKSFVDFGRIDSMKLTHLKDIFMTAFELKEENDKNLDKD